jgi:hypothetical protein
MPPTDYNALAKMLMGNGLLGNGMAQPVADNPFARRNAVNPLMGLEGAGGPRQGGGGGYQTGAGGWLVTPYSQGRGNQGMREFIQSVPDPKGWVKSRIGQIERDRRGTMYKGNPDPVGGTPKVDGKYPFNYELHELRKMLKELP